MKCFIFAILSIVALSDARHHRYRRNEPTPPECGPNEERVGCGTACQPTCANPNPQLCTLQCALDACQCKSGFFRNADNDCVPGSECEAETKCLRDLLTANIGLPGAFVPSCGEDGHFDKEQCHGSTGNCWCVEHETGDEIDGTRTGPSEDRHDCYGEDASEEGSDQGADQYLF